MHTHTHAHPYSYTHRYTLLKTFLWLPPTYSLTSKAPSPPEPVPCPSLFTFCRSQFYILCYCYFQITCIYLSQVCIAQLCTMATHNKHSCSKCPSSRDPHSSLRPGSSSSSLWRLQGRNWRLAASHPPHPREAGPTAGPGRSPWRPQFPPCLIAVVPCEAQLLPIRPNTPEDGTED